MNKQFIYSNKQLYINLETYRKTGEAMRTPVWFIEENRIIFIRTLAESGKVKGRPKG
jgi:hypothetical protein